MTVKVHYKEDGVFDSFYVTGNSHSINSKIQLELDSRELDETINEVWTEEV